MLRASVIAAYGNVGASLLDAGMEGDNARPYAEGVGMKTQMALVLTAGMLLLAAGSARGADTNEYAGSTNRWHGESYDGWDRQAMDRDASLHGNRGTIIQTR
jgi:hypothetical protein